MLYSPLYLSSYFVKFGGRLPNLYALRSQDVRSRICVITCTFSKEVLDTSHSRQKNLESYICSKLIF